MKKVTKVMRKAYNAVVTVLAFLQTHQAKIATLVAGYSSYEIAVSDAISSSQNKIGAILAIAVLTYKFLDGNSKWETTSAALDAGKTARK